MLASASPAKTSDTESLIAASTCARRAAYSAGAMEGAEEVAGALVADFAATTADFFAGMREVYRSAHAKKTTTARVRGRREVRVSSRTRQ